MDRELKDEIEALKRENEKLKAQLQTYKESTGKGFYNSITSWKEEPGEKQESCCKESLMDKRLYKNIFVNNTSIMLLIDPATGNIIDANYAASRFYGYDIQQLNNMNIAEINILSNRSINENMKNAIYKKQNKFQFKHKIANGEIRNVEISSSPIEIKNKIYLHTIVHDITENAKKVELLDESEKKFEQLFNNINDALFVFKIDENNCMPSSFIEVNSIACERLGYTYEELLNLTPFDVDSHDCHQLMKIFQRVSKTKKINLGAFETEHVTKNGRHIPIEVNTHVFDFNGEKSILAVARDITKRKEIEKNLRQSIEKQERIMSFLPDAVLIVQGNKITFVNESASNMLGYKAITNLLHKDFLSIIHSDYHKSVKQRLRDMEKKNMVAPLIEEKYIKRNGEVVDVEVTGVKIPYDNSSAFLMVARDITQRKQVKDELDEKIEFEKLRTEFFSNISHELRTPLNVILGSLQLLELYDNEGTHTNQTEKYKKIHKKMKQNCYRLLRLVNNIIDITKIDAGFYSINLQNYDIVSLIKDIVISVEDYVKNKNLKIQLDTNLNELIISCDPEKIERIILNLLSNAIKFTEPNGTIKVGIKNDRDHVEVIVKDTGIGIPKENLGELFNRFTQVDKSITRSQEGSGIGLSLVESLVKMHQGEITIESELNKGSIFTITLPIKKLDKIAEVSYQEYCRKSNVERIHIEFSDIYPTKNLISS